MKISDLNRRSGYHVTRYDNVSSIMKKGLIAQVGERSLKIDDQYGVYLFNTIDDMEDGLDHWLINQFDEDEILVVLYVKYDGLTVVDDPEMPDCVSIVKDNISPDRIEITDIEI